MDVILQSRFYHRPIEDLVLDEKDGFFFYNGQHYVEPSCKYSSVVTYDDIINNKLLRLYDITLIVGFYLRYNFDYCWSRWWSNWCNCYCSLITMFLQKEKRKYTPIIMYIYRSILPLNMFLKTIYRNIGEKDVLVFESE